MRKDEIKLLLDKYIKKNYKEEKVISEIDASFDTWDLSGPYYEKDSNKLFELWEDILPVIRLERDNSKIQKQKKETAAKKSKVVLEEKKRLNKEKQHSKKLSSKKKVLRKKEYNAPYNFDDSKKFILEAPKAQFEKKQSLDEYIKVVDESFIDTIFKIIDERKLKDVEVYKKANIDRKLFSKLRSGGHPSKNTAIALCIALKLSYDETTNLLKKAGYALSKSVLFDVIISFFIENKEYRIDVINKTLMDYDQKILS